MADLSDPQAVVSGGQDARPGGPASVGEKSHRLPVAGVLLLHDLDRLTELAEETR